MLFLDTIGDGVKKLMEKAGEANGAILRGLGKVVHRASPRCERCWPGPSDHLHGRGEHLCEQGFCVGPCSFSRCRIDGEP